MKFALNLNTRQWFVQHVQCGSPTGWTQWERYDRQLALNCIELDWTFVYIT